jgi:hypothetical protein
MANRSKNKPKFLSAAEVERMDREYFAALDQEEELQRRKKKLLAKGDSAL